MVTTEVSDAGEGIAPELLRQLFERRVKGEPGGGMGLLICRAIAESHGGSIWIDSEPGKGTTASFSVPALNPNRGG